MGTGDCINIFMVTQPCHSANGYRGIASISSWLLSPVTLQMGTGDCINIFMATQPCHTANGYWVYNKCFFMATQPCHTANGNWGVHQYLHGCSALSHCKWVLGSASISSWLLSPATLQMGVGDCINILQLLSHANP